MFLVTGHNGFIGSHLVRKLDEEGIEYLGIDIKNGLEYDLRNSSFDFLEGMYFEKVFHLAAQTDVANSVHYPMLDASINIMGTINLLEKLQGNYDHFIYISSAAVYGNPIQIPIPVDHPTNPISPYGVSKLCAEYYVKYFANKFGKKYTVFRLFNVFGDGEGKGILDIAYRARQKDEEVTIYGDGNQVRDFIYIDDVVRTLLRFNENGIYNLGMSKGKSILSAVREILPDHKIKFGPPREGDIARSVAEIDDKILEIVTQE